MQGIIGFKGHKITCIIGILPSERVQMQEIIIDLEVVKNFSKCALSEKIEDTIDYCRLADLCASFAKRGYLLLERFAQDVCIGLLKEFEIESASIRVEKPEALTSGNAFVSLTMSKEELKCLGV